MISAMACLVIVPIWWHLTDEPRRRSYLRRRTALEVLPVKPLPGFTRAR